MAAQTENAAPLDVSKMTKLQKLAVGAVGPGGVGDERCRGEGRRSEEGESRSASCDIENGVQNVNSMNHRKQVNSMAG